MLSFWLTVADIADAIFGYAIQRAAMLTDFGRGAKCGDREPW